MTSLQSSRTRGVWMEKVPFLKDHPAAASERRARTEMGGPQDATAITQVREDVALNRNKDSRQG